MLKFFSLFLFFSAISAQGALNESTRPAQINVYLEQNPPYSVFDARHNAQGLLVDYWQKWSYFTGIPVKYHPYLQQHNQSLLENANQPAVYSGLLLDSALLNNVEQQALFTINSRFYYFSTAENEINSSLIDNKSAITVGGLLAQAQQLPLFSATGNLSYKEYPGLLELLMAVYNGQIDALVLFEGEQKKLNLLNHFLSLLFAEKLLSNTDNVFFGYALEQQKVVLAWVDWGNQLENMDSAIALLIEKSSNSIWGLSSGMRTKLLLIALFVVVLFIFNRSKRKNDHQFKNILDYSPYPLVILSLDGSVIYYFNDEVKSLFSIKEDNKHYLFEEPENHILLSRFINKATHKVAIESERIRLLVDNSFHDIEISAKRVHYKRKTAWLCFLKDVNALLRAEQKLTEERALLRNVLDSIPEQIAFKSPKGTLIGCNEAWAKANKTTVTQATGRRLCDLLPVDLVDKQKQQELAVWTGDKFNIQEWQVLKNKDLRLINTIKLPLYNDKGSVFALLSIENDVTDLHNLNKELEDQSVQRKKTEIALSKQNVLLSTVFEASIDPIGLLDPEGRVIGANNAFAVLMGSNPDEIIGKLQSELLSSDRSGWAERQNQEVMESGEALIFDELVFFEGRKIWYEVCKTPFKDTESNYQGIVIMARDITLRKQTEEKLSSEASDFELKMLLDPLTGIANRRAFDLQLNKLWQEACEEQELLSLVMCDIDFFKAYNDNYGHQKGDEVLLAVAQALYRTCEKLGCFVARYGGEEFVVLIKGENATKALKAVEMLREAVAEANIEHLHSSVNTSITMSMGLSSILASELTTMAMLFAEADSAMYEAKKNGRDQICVY